MEIRYFQKGFNYSEDGTGNRLVVHLQGCNLRCPWCSNPEGMAASGGESADVQAFAQEIISCKRLFFDGGGVTFTGGECTQQKQALQTLLPILKENGVHVAIETNGTCPYEEKFFENIDLLIADCKHYDEEKLSKRVGQVRDYRKNIADYLAFHKNVLVRIPLIDGFNADERDAEEFAKFFRSIPTRQVAFEFLPYHEYGKSKWEKLGKSYPMQGGFIPPGRREKFEEIFKKYNLQTIRS